MLSPCAGVLTIENGNAKVEMINVMYDVKEVIHQIDRIDYPEAEIKTCQQHLEKREKRCW